MTGTSSQPAQVRFVLLDGVAAWRGRRPLRIGPPQRRAVLTALLINAGRVMTTDQLVAAVWGTAAPEKASATLHALISALRKALAPDLAPRERDRLIRTVDRGYLIAPADIDLDIQRFNTAIADAERAKQRGDLTSARAELRAALACYRGGALASVPGPLAERHRCLLARARLVALENLVELDLTVQPEQAVRHDLTGALAANPHRERLHALHIRLLAQRGRTAEALAAYTRIRRVLMTDLGVEPGFELRRLHQQILAGDRPGPVHAPRVVPAARGGDGQRPGAMPHQPVLLGRAGVLAALAGELAGGMGSGSPVVALHGMAGVGKTATATWAAHQFPRSFFLAADADETERRAVLRAASIVPHGLLVLDDVTSATQVRPMLPDNPGCAVLLTSRHRGTRLPCTARVELPPLPRKTATVLFATVVGAVRTAREPDAVTRLLDATAGLPALVLSVAEQVRARPDSSLAEFADRLGGSLEPHLRGLFDRCYTELDPAQAKALRAAARLPGEVTGSAVATAMDLSLHRADGLLAELVERGLLESATGTYRFSPLVREYVVGRTREIEPLTEMCARVAKLTRHLVLDGARAAALVGPERQPSLRGPRP